MLFLSSVLIILKANKNLDMSINASNNFNLNITWSVGSTGTSVRPFFFFLSLFNHVNLLDFATFTHREISICHPT